MRKIKQDKAPTIELGMSTEAYSALCSKDTPQLTKRLIAHALSEEIVYKMYLTAKHRHLCQFLINLAWEWHISTFWERVFAVTINPIFALLGLAWMLFIPCLIISIITVIIIIIMELV